MYICLDYVNKILYYKNHMNKKQLYESIIKNVAKEVKKSLNESFIEEDDL